MKFFLTLIIIFAILIAVQCLTGAAFQAAFWPNLLADLVVATAFGLALDQFTSFTKKPRLVMVIKQGPFYSDTLKWSKAADGQYETSFHVAIKNAGNKMLKPGEGYWHLYFPGASEISGDAGILSAQDKKHIRNLIELPILPKSFVDLGTEFKLKTPNPSAFGIYYFFATEYGYFPWTVEMDEETAAIRFSTMGTFKTKTE